MLGSLLGAFPGAISGASISAMASFQVKQSEQAAVGAAFGLVGSVANMFAPLYFYVGYPQFDQIVTVWSFQATLQMYCVAPPDWCYIVSLVHRSD